MPYKRRRVPRAAGGSGRSPRRRERSASPSSSKSPLSVRVVGDVTVPPGTALAPNVTFIKTWSVVNDGVEVWDRAFLVFVSGSLLAQSPSIALPAVGAGERINVSLEVQAPETGGRALSSWAFMDAAGRRFGEPLVIDVNVTAAHAHDINAARDALAALIRVGRVLGMPDLPPLEAPPLGDGPSAFPYLEELWAMAKALEAHTGADTGANELDDGFSSDGELVDASGDEPLFEISVRWRSGNQVFTLSVSASHTVADVKSVVAGQAGLPRESLELAPAFAGGVPPDGLVLLDASRTLASYGLGSGTVLELLVAPGPATLGPTPQGASPQWG
ncbi:uncharacterized protein AMSG_03174 [Thecamonas trahens ATCC 50062]|uniref:Ubiquitin-like domain-containing protein n=1 Tax=Thecamonas trahens ATCC 50062 TaxID=461836 RepID=A0A0L0D3H0_THETB|nr:hypothetical protein AMSG_03174 [Thecamonas trahens ATCC 50062]KNC46745.1 hypothetical protein AMSG_03174 [Thecamonas trahens ATCC 50062]|eukprot:XP_013760025.1 hypothetical protein AMSG_03174 [Thecamonas trahens ATCC 50062]